MEEEHTSLNNLDMLDCIYETICNDNPIYANKIPTDHSSKAYASIPALEPAHQQPNENLDTVDMVGTNYEIPVKCRQDPVNYTYPKCSLKNPGGFSNDEAGGASNYVGKAENLHSQLYLI